MLPALPLARIHEAFARSLPIRRARILVIALIDEARTVWKPLHCVDCKTWVHDRFSSGSRRSIDRICRSANDSSWPVRDDRRDDPNGRSVAYCGHPGAKGRYRR